MITMEIDPDNVYCLIMKCQELEDLLKVVRFLSDMEAIFILFDVCIIWKSVTAAISINGGKTITISVDNNATNHHFAGQPLFGLVTSFTEQTKRDTQLRTIEEMCVRRFMTLLAK